MPDRQPSAALSDDDLEDLASTLARTVEVVRQHGDILDRLTADVDAASTLVTEDAAGPGDGATGVQRADESRSLFILAKGGDAYTAELAALSGWVDHLLLPVYGREITTARPWCDQWYKHPEAVARLHGLWLAWQQLTDPEAGLTGPSTWHRDHLDHALFQLRSPEGPFAACTTSPGRPNHRVLATPGPRSEDGTR